MKEQCVMCGSQASDKVHGQPYLCEKCYNRCSDYYNYNQDFDYNKPYIRYNWEWRDDLECWAIKKSYNPDSKSYCPITKSFDMFLVENMYERLAYLGYYNMYCQR